LTFVKDGSLQDRIILRDLAREMIVKHDLKQRWPEDKQYEKVRLFSLFKDEFIGCNCHLKQTGNGQCGGRHKKDMVSMVNLCKRHWSLVSDDGEFVLCDGRMLNNAYSDRPRNEHRKTETYTPGMYAWKIQVKQETGPLYTPPAIRMEPFVDERWLDHIRQCRRQSSV